MNKRMRAAGVAFAFVFVAGRNVTAEIIGPWDIQAAPISATHLAGNAGGWLNVVDVPVTINEAFTGFSMIDDGYANRSSGMVIEVTFDVGAVVNTPGDDLVMFEARFDSGEYAISTEFDGFTSELFLDVLDFSDTGVDRDYYYQYNHLVNPADVWAAPIDLSDLGLPLGGSVTKVRFRTTNGDADPLGIGALAVAGAGDSDGDGIPDDKDACPDSDLAETIVIDDCDSGVENMLFDDGCTMADLIAECADGASNHGDFVNCVAHLTNEWNGAGLITGQEKAAIQSCAAQSNIPGGLSSVSGRGAAGEGGLCPGDVNVDGSINVLDLIDVLLCFGQPAVPGCGAEDINGDGVTNVLDLVQLLLAFGTVCP